MSDTKVIDYINQAVKRLPWFPDIKPYQRPLLAMYHSLPEGYQIEVQRGRGRYYTIAKDESGKRPVLVYRAGEWTPLTPACSSPSPAS